MVKFGALLRLFKLFVFKLFVSKLQNFIPSCLSWFKKKKLRKRNHKSTNYIQSTEASRTKNTTRELMKNVFSLYSILVINCYQMGFFYFPHAALFVLILLKTLSFNGVILPPPPKLLINVFSLLTLQMDDQGKFSLQPRSSIYSFTFLMKLVLFPSSRSSL